MSGWAPEFEALLRPHLPALAADQELPGDTRLADLGLDSLSTVNLLIELENGFGVSFPDELLTAETFETADTLWRTVSALSTDGPAAHEPNPS
ncbi:acyl carrier protein [Streptoalloteichus tenebrarius]|uniref:Acyl carrier protein n=1 Tax=Streptoalloteichus tenebrarius (strain ATCC 17920 / DSM 40477 / JCM 4838 / CBS 697.72 / NBRC 16177 / NCIMB 11028 / NRRL B-12390 / A12253. 1 / ISP 5477) TaxID=1933 RepID=A0ABT1HRN0_STRSD|nr:phosphopantetheine-binding protein [Streptoalloteichus tenebrarius]MCP2258142.1 acyl carrier protein [Streptoalloteichus tenebrarius]BFF04631.1 hypothetical protein GCM10020241_63060 [Streptoalloteichus tenebrarius]